MIDLHIHTNYSDGADTLTEVLEKAESLNLEYISITDHDNCRVYKELANIDVKKHFKGQIIPGIEIKCVHDNGKLIELLGYGIDSLKMQEWADVYYKDKTKEKLQQKYFDIMYDKAISAGIKLRPKEQIEFDSNKQWASLTIYNEIKENKENYSILPEDLMNDFDTFSKKYCSNKKFALYIDKTKDYPTVQETVDIIKKCGGLVFVPHVYIYPWIENVSNYLIELKNKYGINGVECFHSTFNDEQIEELLKIAKENNLFISGGSDYHGVNKKNVDLAFGKGNLNIDADNIKNWIMVLQEHLEQKAQKAQQNIMIKIMEALSQYDVTKDEKYKKEYIQLVIDKEKIINLDENIIIKYI